MTNGNGGNGFPRWMSVGLVATAAWFLLLILYCVFLWLKIEAPALNNAFLLLTGGWVGMLTLAQGNKNKRVEASVEKIKEVIAKRPDVEASELE
jgi:hypothetical protein